MDVSVRSGGIEGIATRVLATPVWEEGIEGDAVLTELDARLGGALRGGIEAGDISTKLHRRTELLPGDAALPFRRLVMVGAGKRAEWDAARARTVAGAAVRGLDGVEELTWHAASIGEDASAGIAAAVHGAVLAPFSTGSYKTGDEPDGGLGRLDLLTASGGDEPSAAAERAHVIAEAANLARSLANEPGNKLTPTVFAERAREVAAEVGLEYAVMNEEEMGRRGYGALLGVSRGSAEPARLVTLHHRGGPTGPVLGLVGKGITFDSGGISIKPADRMHLMKGDMSGAAAVLGAMLAIGTLKPALSVVGVLCLSENLPGPTSMKPGDVLTAGNGTTIEILNTDAEGRLVLADGLVHARAEGATHLVDVATLTGAVVVALGRHRVGAFGAHQEWTDRVLAAAEHTGERAWQLPVGPEYREQMNSDVADIANADGREGGSCTAAAFLQEFTDGLPWVHLDIAGAAQNPTDKPHLAKGPTGVATATLTRLALDAVERGLP